MKSEAAMMKTQKKSRTSRSSPPFFSIVIPTLNEAPRIGRLLQSLKKQSFTNFETLIIDGGSADNTIEVSESYSAKVVVEKGCKEFPSRNIGAKLARGNNLLFLSADVVLPEDALAYVARELDRNPETVGVCGTGMPFDSPLWMKIEYLFHWRLLRLYMMLTKDYHASTNFMVVRRDSFLDIGGFADEIFSDTIFFNKLGKKNKVKILPKSLVFVSGRRAKKMGLAKFTTHFLWVFLFDYLPFLRNSYLVNFLQNYSSEYRAKKG